MMRTTDYASKSVVERYKKSVLSHPHIGKPAFIKLIGNVKGMEILDLGCGTGHFCEDLTRKGAAITGVDRSEAFIKIAKANAAKAGLSIDYFCMNGSHLRGIKSRSFDKVYMFQVIMNISGTREMRGVFREIGRVLKPGGEVIFSSQHPLLLRNYSDSFRKMRVPKGFSYYRNGTSYIAIKRLTDLSWMTFKNSHWSLEFLSKVLSENGFVISDMVEPAPKRGKFWKYFKDLNQAPDYLFIKARKIR